MSANPQSGKPVKDVMLIAAVLQDIKDVLKDQKNNKTVVIIADKPNEYYWESFGRMDDADWYDVDYGDIREIPSFGYGVAHDKGVSLAFLKDRGVVLSIKENVTKEDVGLNTLLPVTQSFDVELNLPKFLRYYDQYMKVAQATLSTSESQPTRKAEDSKPKPTVTEQPVTKIALHSLEPKHYSDKKGALTLAPTVELFLVAKGKKTTRPDGKKYLQCLILEKVFKSVNSIKSGVHFRTILSVNDPKITPKMEKKIRNTVAEINKKIARVGGPDNLIKIQNKKVFVNSSYL